MSCVHLFTLFYLRCHDIQYCNCNDTTFHHMLRCCIALRCLPFDVYGIISYHIILWWQYSILQQFLIPPISTSESLIFMESSSKMNHHQVATRKDPCCHGSFSTCTSNSVWLTSVTIWVAVWQGGNLGENVKNLGPETLREQVLIMSQGVSQPKIHNDAHLNECKPTFRCVWTTSFFDSKALPNSFESQAQTPL